MSATVMTTEEKIANETIEEVINQLHVTIHKCKKAGYGSMVIGPLFEAIQEAQYALDVATGKV